MDEQHEKVKSVSENFCTDLISEMKAPDYVLLPGSTFRLADQWRTEWERGVQIPVDQSASRDFSVVSVMRQKSNIRTSKRLLNFLLPKCLIEYNGDGNDSIFSGKRKQVSKYSVDLLDIYWIREFSMFFNLTNASSKVSLDETLFETTMEWLETNCNEAMTTYLGANREAGYGNVLHVSLLSTKF